MESKEHRQSEWMASSLAVAPLNFAAEQSFWLEMYAKKPLQWLTGQFPNIFIHVTFVSQILSFYAIHLVWQKSNLLEIFAFLLVRKDFHDCYFVVHLAFFMLSLFVLRVFIAQYFLFFNFAESIPMDSNVQGLKE